ncbi:dTMP kinase [bacterium]|nr:dTMP kinase [bacterium]
MKLTSYPFISFEGIDGSGKSSLIQCLYDKLIQLGHSVWLTAEPTSNQFGKLIQEWILYSETPLTPQEQILLFTMDRLQHSSMIRSFLDRGYIVLTDRYFDSTTAYQGINEEDCLLIQHLQRDLFSDRIPFLTFLLDIDPEISLERIQRGKDQFEQVAFLTEVRKRYQKIALENPDRVIILDSRQPLEILEKKMWENLLEKGLFMV